MTRLSSRSFRRRRDGGGASPGSSPQAVSSGSCRRDLLASLGAPASRDLLRHRLGRHAGNGPSAASRTTPHRHRRRSLRHRGARPGRPGNGVGPLRAGPPRDEQPTGLARGQDARCAIPGVGHAVPRLDARRRAAEQCHVRAAHPAPPRRQDQRRQGRSRSVQRAGSSSARRVGRQPLVHNGHLHSSRDEAPSYRRTERLWCGADEPRRQQVGERGTPDENGGWRFRWASSRSACWPSGSSWDATGCATDVCAQPFSPSAQTTRAAPTSSFSEDARRL